LLPGIHMGMPSNGTLIFGLSQEAVDAVITSRNGSVFNCSLCLQELARNKFSRSEKEAVNPKCRVCIKAPDTLQQCSVCTLKFTRQGFNSRQ
jgi:hypothetical protein